MEMMYMKKRKEAVTIQVAPDLVRKIEKMANKLGLSRSQLMANFIQTAYDDAVWLQRFGLLTAARTLTDLKEKYFTKKPPSDEKDD
jgi:metal-responsive CopG/Arc/MetJ family transcriptional regulator